MTDRSVYDLTGTQNLVLALSRMRRDRKWIQAELADRMGAGQSWLCDLETGRRFDPQISSIIRMIAALEADGEVVITDPVTGKVHRVPLVL